MEVTSVLVEPRPSWSSFACASVNELPVRSGTATLGAPESITSVTGEPRTASVASCGFCDTTTPFGCFVGRKTSLGRSPICPSRKTACSSLRPTSRGTATFGGSAAVRGALVTTTVVVLWSFF